LKNKKIIGFINCPVSKESLFEKNHQGITEFLSRKENKKNNGVMLLYNKNLSVSPMTTHIPLSRVSKEIDTKKIVEKIKTINNFYKKIFNKKPNFAILGLNPHNFYITTKSREKKIIDKAIKKLNKLKINVKGPIPADSVFSIVKKYNFNVLIGMYHDQVLAPFKALYNFNAINITLGLSYIRISPDHGTAENIAGKNIANPESLVQSIKFFSSIK
jgi:4-hydroxythreonine-4-phosphate dehydrogenase